MKVAILMPCRSLVAAWQRPHWLVSGLDFTIVRRRSGRRFCACAPSAHALTPLPKHL